MQQRQRGMTFLGILVLVVVVGAWVYAAIRLTPKYLEYMKIAATLGRFKVPSVFFFCQVGDSGKNGRMMIRGIAGITPDISV